MAKNGSPIQKSTRQVVPRPPTFFKRRVNRFLNRVPPVGTRNLQSVLDMYLTSVSSAVCTVDFIAVALIVSLAVIFHHPDVGDSLIDEWIRKFGKSSFLKFVKTHEYKIFGILIAAPVSLLSIAKRRVTVFFFSAMVTALLPPLLHYEYLLLFFPIAILTRQRSTAAFMLGIAVASACFYSIIISRLKFSTGEDGLPRAADPSPKIK